MYKFIICAACICSASLFAEESADALIRENIRLKKEYSKQEEKLRKMKKANSNLQKQIDINQKLCAMTDAECKALQKQIEETKKK